MGLAIGVDPSMGAGISQKTDLRSENGMSNRQDWQRYSTDSRSHSGGGIGYGHRKPKNFNPTQTRASIELVFNAE